MKVGFVHLESERGDSVRNAAVRDYLAGHSVQIIDVTLTPSAEKPERRSYVTLANLASVVRILARKPSESLVESITWNTWVSQLRKRLVPRWVVQVLAEAAGVDRLHAEGHVPAYVCALARRQSGIPFVFDVHGLRVEELVQTGAPSVYVQYMRHMEEVAISEAETITVVSAPMRDLLVSRHRVQRDAVVVVPNGTHPHTGCARFGMPLRVIYAGNLARYEKVQDFVETAALLAGKGYEFYLMGDGELRDELFKLINTRAIDISYLFAKPRHTALQRLCDMQVGMVPTTEDLVRRVAWPLKVLDYAACGLPVVTANAGEWAQLVVQYDAGIVTRNSDARQFAAALAELAEPGIWQRKSKNAKRMVLEACQWDLVLAPLLDIYLPRAVRHGSKAAGQQDDDGGRRPGSQSSPTINGSCGLSPPAPSNRGLAS